MNDRHRPFGRGAAVRAAATLNLGLALLAALPAAAQNGPPQGGDDGPLPSEHDSEMTLQPLGGGMVTIKGKVFYPDHRHSGQHWRRYDSVGGVGLPPADRTSDYQDDLGAYYAMVDAFEIDTAGLVHTSCTRKDQVGRGMVQRDGSFSITFSPGDPCDHDEVAHPRYALRVRLRFCSDELCFQVGPDDDSFYELWYGSEAPFSVPMGTTRDVGAMLFSEAGAPDLNDHARAANQYASIVDAIVTVHAEEGIPFRKSTYGKLQVRYPSPYSSGRGTAADLIDLNNSGWPEGGKAIHEYGHIIHRRAWGGDYAGHVNPIQSWGANTVEIPFIAFKEGWANFIQRYVTGRCFEESYDGFEGFHSLGVAEDGIHFPENHHYLLCDWVDTADDDRSGNEGIGDVFTASLYSLWHNLDRTDDTIASYGGHDPEDPGLDVCDMVGYYLEVRKAASEVGDVAHDQYVWWISNLLDNNDIHCADVPSPDALRAYDFSVAARATAIDESTLDAAGDGPMTVTMRATVSNEHPFITAGRGRFYVDDLDTGERLTTSWVLDLGAGRSQSIDFDVDVDAIGGHITARRLVVGVEDWGGEDTEASNDSVVVIVDDDLVRPDLVVSVEDLDYDEATATVSLRAVVSNVGLRAAVPAGGGFMPSLLTRVSVADGTGATVDTAMLLGELAAGDDAEVLLEGTVSASAALLLISYIEVTVDPADRVDETDETNNTLRRYLRHAAYMPYLDFSETPTVMTDWVRTSMFLAEIQYELIRSSLIEDTALLPWMFESSIDRSFAEQLAETLRVPVGYTLPDYMSTAVQVGVMPSLVPNAATAEAQAAALQWRWMP